MSARRTAVEYDLFHTVDDRGCFQPSTHLPRANAASTRVYSVYSLVAYSFNVVDPSWQSHQFKKKTEIPCKRVSPGNFKEYEVWAASHKKTFCCSSKSPIGGWDFEYVNRAFK